ncbi:MAG: lactate utilization protein [Spirochaetales bacterium]|nr:lactate utilization protein [Spirochaetales bacterium]
MIPDIYWDKRLAELKKTLERNNFEVYIAQSGDEATKIVNTKIIPETGAKTILRGDSLTCLAAGVFEPVKQNPELEYIEPFLEDLSFDETMERLRKTLFSDIIITGSNAVTEKGQIVNLDMYGNRIGGITFGPKSVVILVGRNKIVTNLEEAMEKIRNRTAPANAIRLEYKTPCAVTSKCQDCTSPERICNAWSILEKSFPKGKVKVILINEDLGL